MSRAIFFDLDGTLTDSGPGIINCAQLALAHFGIQVPDRDQLRVFVGPPLRQSFARFGVPPASLDEAIARFRARYVPIGKFENTPYPGIAGLLDRLQGAGYRLFVATSKPQVTAQEVLEHFQLARYFERVCGASLDAGRETKEDVISYLLAQIGDPAQIGVPHHRRHLGLRPGRGHAGSRCGGPGGYSGTTGGLAPYPGRLFSGAAPGTSLKKQVPAAHGDLLFLPFVQRSYSFRARASPWRASGI